MKSEAIKYATSIKIEALAQLGRMLKETPRNPGTRMAGKNIGGTIWLPPIDDIPTYAELGLDKKTSKLAQDIAELPEEQLERVKQGGLNVQNNCCTHAASLSDSIYAR